MYISRRKCEMVLAVAKKHHPVARVMYMIEYEPTTMSVRCSGAEIWLIHGFSRNMEFGFFYYGVCSILLA